MDTEKINDAIDFYVKGNSMSATARQFHSTPGTLKKIFLAKGVHVRNQSEQCIIENMRRTKNVDHYFFDPLTQKSAYYLGFFAADATVRKDKNAIKIGLSSLDIDFLNEMKKNMKIENNVKTYQTNNGFECAQLEFSSLKIKQDLAKYGVVPNKTIIGIHLSYIPDEFKLAFLKGFFDGDGCFTYDKNTKQSKVKFTSYTKEILEEIQQFIGAKGGIYTDKRRAQLYSLEFSTMPSLKIMEEFYKLDTPCLLRKKQKYEDCLKLRK